MYLRIKYLIHERKYKYPQISHDFFISKILLIFCGMKMTSVSINTEELGRNIQWKYKYSPNPNLDRFHYPQIFTGSTNICIHRDSHYLKDKYSTNPKYSTLSNQSPKSKYGRNI